MQPIQAQIESVRQQITACANAAKRDPASIKLLAVSKTQPAERLQAAYEAGQRAFGENYLQEALDKINALSNLDIEWHFIGPVQSNKTRDISENFDWVHTVDRLKIAQRLNDQRPAGKAPLNVCIQVNIDQEASKSGCLPDELEALALNVTDKPNLQLRGLMAIPSPNQQGNCAFSRMRALLEQLQKHPKLSAMDTLSMGMSGDMAQAIAQGATIVRIGTAIFGARD